jgi:hypothetical protein
MTLGENMKTILSFLLTLSSLTIFSASSQAQETQVSGPPVLKILAIGRHASSTVDTDVRDKLLPAEAREGVKLYLAGKVDQWYYRKDNGAVIFILNVATTEEARSLLESMPLGKAHILTFDYIPLSPMMPLATLIGPPQQPSK